MKEERAVFRPLVPPRNLKDELIDRLTGEIINGSLKPNDKLPTEQEMIQAFGVSRTVVREALAALRADGLIQTRQGAGAFVSEDLRRRPFRIDPDGTHSYSGVLDVMELRMSVEIEAAGLAAERRTDKQLKAVAEALKHFKAAVERGEAAVEADFEFHCSVAEATGNHYFRSFLSFLGSFIIPRQSIRPEVTDPDEYRRYLEKVNGEHEAIHQAIADKNPSAARRAMRKHLVHGRNRYHKLAEHFSDTQ